MPPRRSNPDEMEVTAMADARRVRLDAANKYLHLPEARLFDSAEALLEQPKLAEFKRELGV